MIHHRGCYCTVAYPSEIEDTAPSHSALPDQPSWLRGWNFTTDLYRILERVLDVIATDRIQSTRIGPPSLSILNHNIGSAAGSSLAAVMPYVNGMYDRLPAAFKQVRPMSGNLEADIDSFQAANIVVTIYVSASRRLVDFVLTFATQTIKMAILCTEGNISERCKAAGELLAALKMVPTAYMLAISSPLVCPFGAPA